MDMHDLGEATFLQVMKNTKWPEYPALKGDDAALFQSERESLVRLLLRNDNWRTPIENWKVSDRNIFTGIEEGMRLAGESVSEKETNTIKETIAGMYNDRADVIRDSRRNFMVGTLAYVGGVIGLGALAAKGCSSRDKKSKSDSDKDPGRS